MEQLKYNGQRAKNAIMLIWIVLAMEIVSFISGYLQYELLQTAAISGELSMETANANDTRELVVGIMYFIASVISAIMFIQWFRRAYFNLNMLVNDLSHTDGWAAASWFVPIVNLYRPYRIMKELYRETEALLTAQGETSGQSLTTGFLGWWWALWIISNFLGQFVFRYSMKAESIDDLTVGTVAGMIGNIIGIPLAIITVKVIRDYSQVEPALRELKVAEEPAAANPEVNELA